MTSQTDAVTVATIYADLRRTGRTVLAAEHGTLISGVRRRAKADGLAVSQYREPARKMSRNQARNRCYTLGLTKPGSDLLVTPDAALSAA